MLYAFFWPGVSILHADVSKHSVSSLYQPAYEDGRQRVPKRRHIKFTRQGITQKKAYNIQNTAEV